MEFEYLSEDYFRINISLKQTCFFQVLIHFQYSQGEDRREGREAREEDQEEEGYWRPQKTYERLLLVPAVEKKRAESRTTRDVPQRHNQGMYFYIFIPIIYFPKLIIFLYLHGLIELKANFQNIISAHIKTSPGFWP